jgi:hypothetical protein
MGWAVIGGSARAKRAAQVAVGMLFCSAAQRQTEALSVLVLAHQRLPALQTPLIDQCAHPLPAAPPGLNSALATARSSGTQRANKRCGF